MLGGKFMDGKVGIFWYFKNKVLGDAYELANADEYGEILGPKLGHYEFWPEIQNKELDLQFEEYEYIPRGRVMFNTEKQQFILISSKKIVKNKEAIKAIKTFFALPEDAKCVLKTDLHYENPLKLKW